MTELADGTGLTLQVGDPYHRAPELEGGSVRLAAQIEQWRYVALLHGSVVTIVLRCSAGLHHLIAQQFVGAVYRIRRPRPRRRERRTAGDLV